MKSRNALLGLGVGAMLAGQVLTGCGGGSPTSPENGGNTASNLTSFYTAGDLGGDVSINRYGTEAKVRVNGNDVCYTANGVNYYIDQTNGAISVVIGGSGLEKVVRVPQAIVPTGEMLAENLYGTQADLYRVLGCPQGEVLYANGRVMNPPYTEIPELQPAPRLRSRCRSDRYAGARGGCRRPRRWPGH